MAGGNRLGVNTSGGLTIHHADGRLLGRRAGRLADATATGQLALVRGRDVELFDARGRRLARVPGNGGQWSPDGRLFAVARARGIVLVGLDGRTRTLSRTLAGGPWSPDGLSLLANDPDFRSVVVGLDGRVRPSPVGNALWSPAGRSRASLRVVSRSDVPGAGSRRRALHYRSGCDAGVGDLAWLDRGRMVLTQGGAGQNDADLWLATSAGRLLRRLTTSRDWEENPAWSPDGRTLAYESSRPNTHAYGCVASFDPTVRLVSASGRALGRLTATAARQPVWSPDGNAIAFERVSLSDEDEFGLVVVDLATRRERQLTNGPAGRPSWSPDGREVAVEDDGRLVAVDVASRAPDDRGRLGAVVVTRRPYDRPPERRTAAARQRRRRRDGRPRVCGRCLWPDPLGARRPQAGRRHPRRHRPRDSRRHAPQRPPPRRAARVVA